MIKLKTLKKIKRFLNLLFEALEGKIAVLRIAVLRIAVRRIVVLRIAVRRIAVLRIAVIQNLEHMHMLECNT